MRRDNSATRIIPRTFGMEFLSARLSRHQFPVHFHETFVLQLVASGTDRSFCDGEALTATRGQLFVHGPGLAHSGGPFGESPLVYRAVYPSVRLTSELLRISPTEIPTAYSAVFSDGPTVNLAGDVLQQLESAPASVRTFRLLRDLLSRIIEHAANETQRRKPSQPVQTARFYLERNYERDVTVAELSKLVGLSQFHLIREFKRNLGITPRQFLISQRVAVAKSLLALNRPLVDVAFESGFADQAHLSRCFKRVTAVSPGQFRAAANSNSVQEPPETTP